MNNIFIKNPTDENLGFLIKKSESAIISNSGPEGAIAIDDHVGSICLSPLTAVIPANDDSISPCIGLGEDDIFAIEINGVMVPHYFKPEHLPQYFNANPVHGIRIDWCTEGMQPMIVRNSVTGEGVIVSYTELDIVPSEGFVLKEQRVIDAEGDTPTQYVYSFRWESQHLPQASLSIKPAIGNGQIKGLYIDGMREVTQWYTGGYDGFLPNYGLGNSFVEVPDHIPPNTTKLDYMFAGSPYFNQDISIWDYSNIKSINYFISGTGYFDKDLSTICVPLIDGLSVVNFTNGSSTFPDDKLPVWGTCPMRPEPPVEYYPENAMILRGISTAGGNVFRIASHSPLNVIFPDTAVITEDPVNEIYAGYEYYYEATIPMSQQDRSKIYITHSEGDFKLDGLVFSGPYEVVQWYEPGYVELGSVSTGTMSPYVAIVPEVAPLTDNLSYMFPTYFMQNLNMWEVGPVKNMTSMFGQTLMYPYDLDMWCVGNIFTAPHNFRPTSMFPSGSIPKDPVWGTCPSDPDFKPDVPDPVDNIPGVSSSVILNEGESCKVYSARTFANENYSAGITINFVADAELLGASTDMGGNINDWIPNANVPGVTVGTVGMSTDWAKIGLTGNEDNGWNYYVRKVTNDTDKTLTISVLADSPDDARCTVEKILPVDMSNATIYTEDITTADRLCLALYGDMTDTAAMMGATTLLERSDANGVVSKAYTYMEIAGGQPILGLTINTSAPQIETTAEILARLNLTFEDYSSNGGKWSGGIFELNPSDIDATFKSTMAENSLFRAVIFKY